ncbi:cellulose synthase-like protein H1 [Malania oleifera]|uniref:cellulose synthase-like protein H1 n=1 Tax=Malania oleifera TaxID=397392 RepID=UPI0025ADC1E7|nr:cellulose synthase-like protein H1 [Malania oleifera]
MANPAVSLPFCERIPRKNTLYRVMHLIILFLLLSLLLYRLLYLNTHGFTWLLAFLCESWFTFLWILNVSTKWNPVECKTYPDRLQHCFSELPPVDMFVTTADPVLEPPIITVNTVLSLLAVDYPASKLACYVSDDGGSAITFYALTEASKFAKLWLPFCKKYSILVRAPFRYFSVEQPTCPTANNSVEFQLEWRMMKEEYQKLCQKIEQADKKLMLCDHSGDFEAFSNIERRNHSSIIKVIWENKEGLVDELPNLVYISREKRPEHPHHYKAGAMNVLTRVSGVMTNAPFLLNLDCDMYANNPLIVRHAMCLLLGFDEKYSGFVQSPQMFYGGVKDEPFGNHLVILQEYSGKGCAGIQGPFYGGTGCFHRRKVIYGLSPDETKLKRGYLTAVNGKFPHVSLQKMFGNSIQFIKSASQILSELDIITDCALNLSTSIEAAYQVAGCGYEYGTSWGTKVGWLYGSTVEDVLTGMMIHARGWRSVYCTPDPPAFLGCAPSDWLSGLTQQKRWATGLLEILSSKNSPFITTLTTKLQFRQGMGYVYFLIWGLRSIPELCYAALPAYCLISNSYFLPKVHEPAMFISITIIFVLYNLSNLLEYLQIGLSVRTWWNCQQMSRIISATAWIFAVLNVILKILGISETVFEVTKKDESSPDNDVDTDANTDASNFTFDESLIFVPGITLLLVHISALIIGLLGFQEQAQGGAGEVICSMWVVFSFWPFVKGLFRRGKYGIPLSSLSKSAAIAFLFVQYCRWTAEHKVKW